MLSFYHIEFSTSDGDSWGVANQALGQVEWYAKRAIDEVWDGTWKSCETIPDIAGYACKGLALLVKAHLVGIYYGAHLVST